MTSSDVLSLVTFGLLSLTVVVGTWTTVDQVRTYRYISRLHEYTARMNQVAGDIYADVETDDTRWYATNPTRPPEPRRTWPLRGRM